MTRLDSRVFTAEDLQNREIRLALMRRYGRLPSVAEVVRDLNWSREGVRRVLFGRMIPCLSGEEIFSIKPADLDGCSLPEIRSMIRQAIVVALSQMPVLQIVHRGKVQANKRGIARVAGRGVSDQEAGRILRKLAAEKRAGVLSHVQQGPAAKTA